MNGKLICLETSGQFGTYYANEGKVSKFCPKELSGTPGPRESVFSITGNTVREKLDREPGR